MANNRFFFVHQWETVYSDYRIAQDTYIIISILGGTFKIPWYTYIIGAISGGTFSIGRSTYIIISIPEGTFNIAWYTYILSPFHNWHTSVLQHSAIGHF